MHFSSWLVSHFHQTRISRGLRKSPISPAANYWWKRHQTRKFRQAMSNLPKLVHTEEGGSRPHPLLTHDDLQRGSGVTAEKGREFSLFMSTHCETSKFREFGYEDVYGTLLCALSQKRGVLLELGIGHNDPKAPSGMAEGHKPGSSLTGWAKYFPLMEIHGADIREEVLVDTDEYRTHYVDQRDPNSLRSLASCFPNGLDIVIDDGLHTPEANANVVSAFLPFVRPGGFLFIEDILPEFDSLWLSLPRCMENDISYLYFPGSSLRGGRTEGLAVFFRADVRSKP